MLDPLVFSSHAVGILKLLVQHVDPISSSKLFRRIPDELKIRSRIQQALYYLEHRGYVVRSRPKLNGPWYYRLHTDQRQWISDQLSFNVMADETLDAQVLQFASEEVRRPAKVVTYLARFGPDVFASLQRLILAGKMERIEAEDALWDPNDVVYLLGTEQFLAAPSPPKPDHYVSTSLGCFAAYCLTVDEQLVLCEALRRRRRFDAFAISKAVFKDSPYSNLDSVPNAMIRAVPLRALPILGALVRKDLLTGENWEGYKPVPCRYDPLTIYSLTDKQRYAALCSLEFTTQRRHCFQCGSAHSELGDLCRPCWIKAKKEPLTPGEIQLDEEDLPVLYTVWMLQTALGKGVRHLQIAMALMRPAPGQTLLPEDSQRIGRVIKRLADAGYLTIYRGYIQLNHAQLLWVRKTFPTPESWPHLRSGYTEQMGRTGRAIELDDEPASEV